jgi:Zn finger protein HypA/HybF involved in hydrogenase expression
MPKIIIKKTGWKCYRCNHQWKNRNNKPKFKKPITCPRCHSPYWDILKEKKEKKLI